LIRPTSVSCLVHSAGPERERFIAENDSPDLLDEFEEPAFEGEPVERANGGETDREPTNSE
jgi:hypothetical protein